MIHSRIRQTLARASFVLLSFASIGAMSTWEVCAQSTPSIQHTVRPYESQGFASWLASTDPQFDHYRVEIQQASVVGETTVFTTVSQFNLTENYFRLAKQYMNIDGGNSYYYTVNAVNVDGIDIEVDTPEPVCNGCNTTILCRKKCNGPTYAYEIRLNEINNNKYYAITSTYHYLDQNTGVAVPYYRYMTASQYSDWVAATPNYTSYQVVHLNLPSSSAVVSISGQAISGNVKGIGKKTEQFTNYAPTPYLQTANPNACSFGLNYFINTYNAYGDPAGQGLDDLYCVPTATGPGGKFKPGEKGKITKSYSTFTKCMQWVLLSTGQVWANNFFSGCGDSAPNFTQGGTSGLADVLTMLASRDPIWNSGVDPEDIFEVDEYFQFSLARIDDPHSFGTSIDPSIVFDASQGTINDPNLNLSDGLYKMDIFFKDGGVIPMYFVIAQSSGNKRAIADSEQFQQRISIYPNPAKDIVKVVYDSGDEATLGIRIMNTAGQTMIERNGLQSNMEQTIDVQGLSSGLYLIQLTSGTNISTQQLIID